MLNKRYFWKVLIIFLGIFYLTFQVTWFGVTFYLEKKNDHHFSRVPTNVNIIAKLLTVSGESEALQYIASLPESSHYAIVLYNELYAPPTALPQLPHRYEKFVESPDGTQYIVEFKDNRADLDEIMIFNLPLSIFEIALFAGVLFSIFLAWNLTLPMKIIKKGFNQVANGDFSARISDKLRYRYDEFGDLATDFDAMVEKLELLISARQTLLHDISHELRTPLTRLQLAIALAQQHPENMEKSLERIELESMRINSLIGEMINYLRTDFVDENADSINIILLVEALLVDLNKEALLQNKHIIFENRSTQDIFVYGSQIELKRSIENVLRNAIRFSPIEMPIKVILSTAAQEVKIEIVDEGLGVDPCKLSSIFEPFVRIQSPQLGKGYGLGLAATRKIIQAHKGQVTAQNGKEQGLIVTIVLPRLINKLS